jgi:hypothetical protein
MIVDRSHPRATTLDVDTPIADVMLTVVRLIRDSRRYPDALGFGDEIAAVWRSWRGATLPNASQARTNAPEWTGGIRCQKASGLHG